MPRTHYPHGSLLDGSVRPSGLVDEPCGGADSARHDRAPGRATPPEGLGIIDAVLGDGLGPAIATFQEVTAKFA